MLMAALKITKVAAQMRKAAVLDTNISEYPRRIETKLNDLVYGSVLYLTKWFEEMIMCNR